MNKKFIISDLYNINDTEIDKKLSECDIFISQKEGIRNKGLLKNYSSVKKESSEIILIEKIISIKEEISNIFAGYNDSVSHAISVSIDISLISRKNLAIIFSALCTQSKNYAVDFSVIYSLAKYMPHKNIDSPNERVESVGPIFSGWTTTPGLPVTSIVGLGYEKNKALGAIEYLESNQSLLLIPNSTETRYRDNVLEVNETLLSFTKNKNIIDYDVQNPVEIIFMIDSLISGYKSKSKLVLLPFGPKIFYACSLIASLANPEVAVWHVSSVDKDNRLSQDREIVATFGFSFKLNVN
jgi:hypothetical protein